MLIGRASATTVPSAAPVVSPLNGKPAAAAASALMAGVVSTDAHAVASPAAASAAGRSHVVVPHVGKLLLILEERVHRLLGHLGTALRKAIGRVRIDRTERVVDGQAEQGARHVVRTKAWEET